MMDGNHSRGGTRRDNDRRPIQGSSWLHYAGEEGSRATSGPAYVPYRPILFARVFRFSSQVLSDRTSCTILSTRPCLTSLILTFPNLISLSRKKSNSLNSPSSLSSFGPVGNAESGTGGSDGFPLIASANLNNARPPIVDTNVGRER